MPLGNIRLARGQYVEAEPFLRRVLTIQRALGPGHPLMADSLERLAGLLHKAKRSKEADELTAKAVKIRAKRPSEEREK